MRVARSSNSPIFASAATLEISRRETSQSDRSCASANRRGGNDGGAVPACVHARLHQRSWPRGITNNFIASAFQPMRTRGFIFSPRSSRRSSSPGSAAAARPCPEPARGYSRMSNFGAERRLRLVAKAADGQLADLVGERLARGWRCSARPRRWRRSSIPRIFEHVLDRLVAGPTFGMDAGVDHEAHRAKHLVVQIAEALVGVGVHLHRVAEGFRVERPAFDISGVAAEAHEGGQLGFSCARLIWK